MLLHGIDDNEILDVWLKSIGCQEFVRNFIDSGYNVSTLSRLTPQDLTAIGVTDPSKRQKLLAEIKRLNLQDGIPNFMPAGLSHLLSLIKLDKLYYKSLCDQNIDTLEKLCQLTWEDFEELGIQKLGHQKRLQLAIERIKNLEKEANKNSSKSVAEPIYDTNPSQILLMASTENHSNNGPVVNKQSSTCERSSTGSGSLQSINSSLSYQQTNYSAPQQNAASDTKSLSSITYNMPNQYISQPMQQLHPQPNASKATQQPIYDHIRGAPNIQSIIPPFPNPHATNQNAGQQHQMPPPLMQHNSINGTSTLRVLPNVDANYIKSNKDEQYLPNQTQIQNQQSRYQLPFNVLANLPKHQQQLLQQSSLYATLSRCPTRSRQPPPVPTRRDSLKTTSLTDYMEKRKNNLIKSKASSSNGQIPANKRNINSQVTLTKNKSFSGNAHMEASRAKFLHNSMIMNPGLHQGLKPIESRTNPLIGSDFLHNLLANDANYTERVGIPYNFDCISLKDLGQVSDQMDQNLPQSSMSTASMTTMSSTRGINERVQDINYDSARHLNSSSNNNIVLTSASTSTLTSIQVAKPEFDVISTTSMKQSNSSDNNSNYISGSSQTLYNSASSGSNEQNLDQLTSSPAKGAQQEQSNINQQAPNTPIKNRQGSSGPMVIEYDCNATLGRDDNFPPPPSPLSLSDIDEHDVASFNKDRNFTDISRGLVAFRIGS